MITLQVILAMIVFIIVVFWNGWSGGSGSSVGAAREPFNVFSVMPETEILKIDRQLLSKYFEGIDFQGYNSVSNRKIIYLYTYVSPEPIVNSRYVARKKLADLEDIINSEFRSYFNDNYSKFLMPGVDFKNHMHVFITKGAGRVYIVREY